MSILNVDKIQPIGGGSTITVDATDIQASTGTIRASTFSGDVSATGIGVTSLSVAGITTFSDNVKISSNKKLTFNNPGFEIYHNNANAYLDNNVGHLYIRNDVDGDTGSNIYIQAKSGENGVSVGNDGAVVLFYDNNAKLQTTNTGTYTTGIGTFTDKISVTGSQNSMLTNNQLIFDRAGTSYIDNSNNSGALSFRIGSSYTVGLFIESDGTVAIPSKLVHLGDTNTFMEFGADTITFDTNGSERLRIDNQGSVIIATGTVTSFGGGNTKLQVRGASSVISDGAQIFDIASTAASNGGTRLAFGVNEDNFTWIRSYESAVGGRDMVFATPNEALRIDTAGRLSLGVNASPGSYPVGSQARQVQAEIKGGISGNNYHHGSLALNCINNNANLHLVRSDNNQNANIGLGNISFSGYDGSDFHVAAQISGIRDAAGGNNDVPGRLVFLTTADGASQPTERLRITSRGYREIRNYHYGPYAFTNDSWKSAFTIGDPGDGKHTTVKFILTIEDVNYRQGFWQGEFVIWSSNSNGAPGVSHIYKKIWDNVGSTNWSGGTVSYQMSGGAFQFKADNGHNDANGNAYIHVLDVIGDIDGSTVATISA